MKERIKIFTRSFDLRLYTLSRGLYEGLGVPVVRLTDQTADGYFHTMLRDTECDIAVNIDEDAFLVSPEAMFSLVRKVVDNGYANAGCPDGGGFCPRSGNPLVTNPFFNVLNLSLIRTRYSQKEVRAFSYAAVKEEMKAAFPAERLETGYDFDRRDYEPYYPFFLWLAYNFRTLYLPSRRHADGVSTVLLDTDGREICYHSWFARFYATPSWAVRLFEPERGRQKARIDALLDEAYALRKQDAVKPAFTLASDVRFLLDKIVRWVVKVPQRISRWPYKIRKKLNKDR